MNWVYSPYIGILHFTSLICVNIAVLAVRRRSTAKVNTLVMLMLSLAVWAFAAGLEAAALDLQAKILCVKLEYIGVVSAPTLYFIFILEYSRRTDWLIRNRAYLLWVFPLLAMLAVFTNEWHHLIWANYIPDPALVNGIIYEHGIGYYVLYAYNYLILLSGIGLLTQTWIRARPPYRRQASILLFSSFFPVAAGGVYLVREGMSGLDLVALSFAMAGIMIAIGILRFKLFNLMPIARDILIDSMGEGVLVLDAQNRIVDINPNAFSLLGISSKDVLGMPIDGVIQSQPQLVRQLLDQTHTTAELNLDTNPPRSIEMNVTILRDRGGHASGRLIVLRNITEYRQTQIALARNVEELSIINQISLAVTAGLDMERVLKTLLEQCRQVVPFDIFYVALYDEANSLVQIPLFYERGHFHTGLSRDIKERPGFIGKVIAESRTIYHPNHVERDTGPLDQPKSSPEKMARASIGIPLTLRERVIGVMSIQSYHPRAYTEDHIRILERIAVQAAIAVENARLYAEVQRLAIIDELTGIYNYRGLLELGAREVERANRFAHPLSLLFFDVDDFRNFNNTYSHAVGNIVLKSVVDRCKSILRAVDILARYGGDEFVVLLPETKITEAEKIACRMVAEVAAQRIATKYGDLGVTISVGITTLNEENPNLLALLDQANLAEHRAKQGQKGVVTIAA
jgi:diguanylate cyclase (GGDEF)-like protein/PAS domain S-box-containing protein